MNYLIIISLIEILPNLIKLWSVIFVWWALKIIQILFKQVAGMLTNLSHI